MVHAAAKSLQSCPNLCDPTDGSPPDSPVPGILQARTLEWVAIVFSAYDPQGLIKSDMAEDALHAHMLYNTIKSENNCTQKTIRYCWMESGMTESDGDIYILCSWIGRISVVKVTAAKLLQLCPTMCDLMDCSLPGSSFRGIFQARVLELGAIAFSGQNDYNTLKILQIECNPYPYQIVNGNFHSIRTTTTTKYSLYGNTKIPE